MFVIVNWETVDELGYDTNKNGRKGRRRRGRRLNDTIEPAAGGRCSRERRDVLFPMWK